MQRWILFKSESKLTGDRVQGALSASSVHVDILRRRLPFLFSLLVLLNPLKTRILVSWVLVVLRIVVFFWRLAMKLSAWSSLRLDVYVYVNI